MVMRQIELDRWICRNTDGDRVDSDEARDEIAASSCQILPVLSISATGNYFY